MNIDLMPAWLDSGFHFDLALLVVGLLIGAYALHVRERRRRRRAYLVRLERRAGIYEAWRYAVSRYWFEEAEALKPRVERAIQDGYGVTTYDPLP